MPSAYRDGLSETRQHVEKLVAQAQARGSGLPCGSRALPRALRRELARLAEAMGRPIGCLDDAARVERKVDEYLEAVAAAEAIGEQAASFAPRRRRRWLLLAVGGLLLTVPFAALAGQRAASWHQYCAERPGAPSVNLAALVGSEADRCVYTDLTQCLELCVAEGRCDLREGSCRATTAQHCAASRGCFEAGRCSVRDGRCAVVSDADCSGSEVCRTGGACKATTGPWDGKVCRAGDDLDCAASDLCADHGRCVAIGGACVTRQEKSCAYATTCALEGRCSQRFDGRCFAASDDDCRYAQSCLIYGRCMVQGGRCVALADWGCRGSQGCREWGDCVARDGQCVAPPGEPLIVR